MWHYPTLDPVALQLGPLAIHWYGISYIAGITGAWMLARSRLDIQKPAWSREQISDLVFYVALGVIAGGRLGWILFYGLEEVLENPLRLFQVWKGGMSFHGGFLGVLLAMLLFARKNQRPFFQVTDFIVPVVPIGLFCGRIGNFINTELPGRITDVPWAVIFPSEDIGRHPSSLYQATLEGPVLCLALLWFARRSPPMMSVTGMFCLLYGAFRLLTENFRQPDIGIGFIAFDWLTMGQALSFPMLLTGILLMVLAYRRGEPA